MNRIQLGLDSINGTTIPIGFEGENEHTRVIIYCTSLINKYPNAVATMVIKPPVGDIYPKTITQDDNMVIWDVTDVDCSYPGNGQYQLTFTDNNEVIKTYIGSFFIRESLSTTGQPPEPLEDWLQEAQEALEAFDQDVSDAEAWAVGTRNGTPVESTDPTYHNNAKYYADHLSISISGTTLILSSQ